MLVLGSFEVSCACNEGCCDEEAGLLRRDIQPQNMCWSAGLQAREFWRLSQAHGRHWWHGYEKSNQLPVQSRRDDTPDECTDVTIFVVIFFWPSDTIPYWVCCVPTEIR